MITLSVIVGLWMLVSIIMVLVEYMKFPDEGFLEAMMETGFIPYVGTILGIISIIVFSMIFIVMYLP